VPDGRKVHHARAAAVVTAALTSTIGFGLATASPATAAPDHNSLGAVQARAERLGQQAEAAQMRHDKARAALTGTRGQLSRLTTQIHRHRVIMDDLRAQVANEVVSEYADDATATTVSYAGAGASAPATNSGSETTTDSARTDSDTEISDVLLTNAAVVSEDTGQRGDAMARSNTRLQQLSQRRIALRDQVTMLAGLEKSLRTQEQKVDARSANANAALDRLEAKAAAERMARLGGPVLAYAKSQVGKAYVYGAAGPDSFDCSGLTMMAWKQSGVNLPHSSSAQYSAGRHVSESELQPGDLVFYYSPISHVGIYIGDGQIVNALNPGSGVQISGLHDMPYVGAVRPG
jgi:cell wall-associated NlpC family hydrolase